MTVPSFTADSRALARSYDAVEVMGDECTARLEDGVLHTAIIDPERVSHVHVNLPVDHEGEAFFGLESSALNSLPALDAAYGHTDVEVDSEDGEVRLETGPMAYTTQSLSPGGMREPPDMPGMDMDVETTVSGAMLVKALESVFEMGWRGCRFTYDDAGLTLGSEETDQEDDVPDDVPGQFRIDVPTETAEKDGPAETLMSADLLRRVYDTIPLGVDVTLRFDDEFPLVLSWPPVEGSDGTVEYMQAPRLEDDEDDEEDNE